MRGKGFSDKFHQKKLLVNMAGFRCVPTVTTSATLSIKNRAGTALFASNNNNNNNNNNDDVFINTSFNSFSSFSSVILVST